MPAVLEARDGGDGIGCQRHGRGDGGGVDCIEVAAGGCREEQGNTLVR